MLLKLNFATLLWLKTHIPKSIFKILVEVIDTHPIVFERLRIEQAVLIPWLSSTNRPLLRSLQGCCDLDTPKIRSDTSNSAMNGYEFGGFDNSIPDPFNSSPNWLECVKTAHVNLITFVHKMSQHLSNLITLFFLHIYLWVQIMGTWLAKCPFGPASPL